MPTVDCVRLFKIGELNQLARIDVVFEIIPLPLFFRRRAFFHSSVPYLDFLGAQHFKLDPVLVFHEPHAVDGQVLCIEGIADDPRQLRSQFCIVEQNLFRAGRRIHYVPVFSIRCFENIPETVGLLQPVGVDRSGKDHAVELLWCKACSQLVIRFLHGLLRKKGDAEKKQA